ncbi:hypothetical protein GGD62_005731 [Bradyrhizobium sp. ERR14]|nr:hypothetical protein [Bradyrhizobium sp. ERR14]
MACFDVFIKRAPAHAGTRPEDGRSAIRELGHVIQTLEAMNDLTRGITVNVGVVRGGTRPNVVAELAYAQVDMRVPTMAHADELVPQILGISSRTEGVSVNVSGELNRARSQARWRAFWRVRKVRHRHGSSYMADVAQQSVCNGSGDLDPETSFPTVDSDAGFCICWPTSPSSRVRGGQASGEAPAPSRTAERTARPANPAAHELAAQLSVRRDEQQAACKDAANRGRILCLQCVAKKHPLCSSNISSKLRASDERVG